MTGVDSRFLSSGVVFGLIAENQDLHTGATIAYCRLPLSGQQYICVWVLLSSRGVGVCVPGSRTDGVITVGSRGVKLAFRPEIEACTSCRTDSKSGVRILKPEPAAAQTGHVVFGDRSLHQL